MTHYSPLRYPGGKGRLYPTIKYFFKESGKEIFVEGLAGGAELSLQLLLNGDVSEVWMNDSDIGIYSFWFAVFYDTDRLIWQIYNTDISISEREIQKEIYKNAKEPSFDAGFAAFYLNRTNRSGILNAGVIGGNDQSGTYRIDCRFPKEKLIEKIKKIAEYKTHVHLFSLDICDLLDRTNKNMFVYLDPPYVSNGKSLYPKYFTWKDHVRLKEKLEAADCEWALSYDDTKEIRDLYPRAGGGDSAGYDIEEIEMPHAAANKGKSPELLIRWD